LQIPPELAPPHPRGPQHTVSVASPFVVRVAGLPFETLASLSSTALRDAVRDVLAVESWLTAEGRALADELHDVIGASREPALRPGLVGLRRSLFRGSTPRAAEWTPRLRAALPSPVAGRVEHWISRFGERDRLTESVAGTLARETDRSGESLLHAVADPAFRHGLAQSSPTLSEQLEKWLVHREGHPPRRVLVRLARYVSRAATKTSPNSTFTTVGAGVWTADGTRALAVGPLPPRRGFLELYGPLATELEAAASASDVLRPKMLVRVNPSLTPLGDRLVVMGRPPVEEIASVTALPEVARCVVELGDGWLTLAGLRARLAGDAPSQKVHAFVDRLVELGVLELRTPVDDQCRDPFGALAGWIEREGGAEWAETARACRELSALIGPPTDLSDVEGHGERLRRIRHAVAELRAHCGRPHDPQGQPALVHEHAAFVEPVATAGLPAWREALADLDRLRRWMAPHDSCLPLRLALGSYWGTRFATAGSVPFLVFHQALLADLKRAGTGPEIADLRVLLTPGPPAAAWRSPVLRELAGLRGASLDVVLHAPGDADGVARVDPGRLEECVAGMPPAVRPTSSVTWFVQADGRRLVVNSAMAGYGRSRCRSLYLIGEANGGRLPAGLAPPAPDAPSCGVVADSSGDFGHPLNLRLPGGGHELDYPFTRHRDARRPRLALGDLTVERDPATGTLRLRHPGTGAIVTPAHLGMVVDSGLPPALRLLVRGMGANPTWLLRPAELLAPGPDADGTVVAPRIESGLAVLRRATWTVPVALLPRRSAGERDADRLLRLHRWLAGRGIPARCFVRADTGAAASRVAKSRKPLYVDFDSPWLVAMFERLVAAPATRVTFCEALPSPGPGTHHVTELLVETTAVRP